MLKKIPTRQLRVGMHVHQVCGPWLEHAIWRRSFRVSSAAQLAKLQGVPAVIIDTRKGLDVVPEPQQQSEVVEVIDDVELATAEAPQQGSDLPDRAPEAPVSRSLQAELARAGEIVGAARGAMQAMFTDARLGKAIDTEHCLPLVEDITDSVRRNPGAVVSLARLKTSDDYTYMHSVAVCALMVALARQLGLNDADTREAGMAGLVHDIGKALMPPDVLNKPGALTPEEFAIMKGHPEAGHRMLQEGRGVGAVPLDVALHHHEKINGKGYPHGLQGEAISLFARMGAICDVYDAITSNRPYKEGWDPAESIQKMAVWARDGHFDEAIFQAFVKSIGIYPTGSLVRLQSGRLGVVVDQGHGSLLKPLVRVFYSTKSQEPIPPQLLDLAQPGCSDQIVARESPSDWGFQHLDALWMRA